AFWDALAMQPRRLRSELAQDVRYGVRTFLAHKSLTTAALVSLALGIGVNTALFTLVDVVSLRKLPVVNPDEFVLFEWPGRPSGPTRHTTDRPSPSGKTSQQSGDTFSYRSFTEFRTHNRTLEDVWAFAHLYSATIVADHHAETGTGQYVSGNYF